MHGKSQASSCVVVTRRNADGTETTVHVGALASLSRLHVGEGGVYMEFGTAASAAPPPRPPPEADTHAARAFVPKKTLTQVWAAVYESYKKHRDEYYNQDEAVAMAIQDNIDDVTFYKLWRGRHGMGEPGTSVEGCKRTLSTHEFDISYAPAR